MQINLITVGQSKEKYWQLAEKEYVKRLSRFYNLTLYNVKDENNSLDKNLVLKREEQRILEILQKIKRSYIICLAIEGKLVTSEEFSELIEEVKIRGYVSITFIIGGSYGLSQNIKNKSDLLLSFGKLTFPHQMFKIIFLEQFYRTAKIANNESYHK